MEDSQCGTRVLSTKVYSYPRVLSFDHRVDLRSPLRERHDHEIASECRGGDS